MSNTYKSYVGYGALIVNMQAYGRNSEQFVVGVLTSTPVYYVNVSGNKKGQLLRCTKWHQRHF